MRTKIRGRLFHSSHPFSLALRLSIGSVAFGLLSAYACVAQESSEKPERNDTVNRSEQSSIDADNLAPLRFLVGYCWTAPFPDGANNDTHCYTEMYGRSFIRDRHLVQGDDPDYRGETIYHFDSANNQISYRYWNSRGGVSDGVAMPVEGRLVFPSEHHVRDDGSEVEMQSSITQEGPDQYVSVAEEKVDGDWHEIWRMTFTKSTPSTNDEIPPDGR